MIGLLFSSKVRESRGKEINRISVSRWVAMSIGQGRANNVIWGLDKDLHQWLEVEKKVQIKETEAWNCGYYDIWPRMALSCVQIQWSVRLPNIHPND